MKKLLTMTVVLAGAVSAFAGDFMAGYAKTDITPPLGVFMPGYYHDRWAKEILDPLEVVCLAFDDGKTKAVDISIIWLKNLFVTMKTKTEKLNFIT